MGIPGGANLLLAAGGVSAYEIDQSLRFDGAETLTWTPSVDPDDPDHKVFSFWVKRGALGGIGGGIIDARTSSSSYSELFFSEGAGTNTADSLAFKRVNTGVSTTNIRSLALYRDPSAWYHCIVQYNSNETLGVDRLKMWVNGEFVEHDSANVPNSSQSTNIGINGVQIRVGYTQILGEYLEGYLAEFHMLDGIDVTDAYDFGEYDANGVWRPIAYTGSYGTNGFYLKFDPSATNGIGHDHSGNGNHFTANGFTTSGTDTNVMSDTPTNNFATFNPLQVTYQGSPTYHEGNLHFDLNDGGTTVSTIGVSSGKWYCEIKTEGTMSHRPLIGLNYFNPTSQGNTGESVWPGADIAYAYSGAKWVDYSSSSYGSSWSNGDIIGIALDLDSATQTVTFYLNGTSQGSINLPASGKTWHVSVGSYGADGDNLAFTANFGQRDFEQTQPSGYNSWCTANLPAPSIADGSEYFNTVLYTGTGASHSVTGVGFQPDWVWIKRRDSAASHNVYDAVRGVEQRIKTDVGEAEETRSNGLTSFDSDGFTVVSDAGANNLNGTYVAWNWLAGGSGSSNTSGSITSTVSASPTSGFSIVTYSGNGTSGATVGHGLGVKPAAVIIRRRDASSSQWMIYHEGVDLTAPEDYYLRLDYQQARINNAAMFNDTAPTSTVFTVGNNKHVNNASGTYVAYCFANIEGYSKFGRYDTSNSNAFIYTGFSPVFLMIKNAVSSNYQYFMYDDKRETDNPNNAHLLADLNNAESSNSVYDVDLVSNGFMIRGGSPAIDNGDFVYWAFADKPFGGSGVSPATAR